jgi:hypothetical protein
MPKKRRPARTSHTKRRPPRRPDFTPGPQQPPARPEEREDLDGQPIFADDVAVPSAMGHYGMTGPVETRPEWIGRTAAQQAQRQPGRRTAQLRQRGTSEGAARIAGGQLPTFERAFIVDELRRIAIISGALFALIVILAIVMR